MDLFWPWWTHPAWAVALLGGATALVAVALPEEAFTVWEAPKYLDSYTSTLIALGLIALVLGIVISGLRIARRDRPMELVLTGAQLTYLKRAYKFLVFLTALGYVFWAASAAAQGVGFGDLANVLGREASAIGELKSNSRPIAGLTTLTQFGPIAVAIGVLLQKLGAGGRSYMWLLGASLMRTVFYAERLALIELLVPLVIVMATVGSKSPRFKQLIRLGPLIAAPIVWVIFASSEYIRSWVYYERVTAIPFEQWVSLRLLGYYTTSVNNSALFSRMVDDASIAPYRTFSVIWNAPVLENIVPRPDILGVSAESWWSVTLARWANPEFTNAGSFLVVQGELGTIGMVVFWLIVGVALGALFASAFGGSVPSMIAYAALFIGFLELPRILYWTEGRCFPVLISAILLALAFPKRIRDDASVRRRKRRPFTR